MKRWTKMRPLRKIKRGIAAFLVCFIVVLPLLLTGWQWRRIALGDTSRRATPLPAMYHRSADSDTPPQLFKQPLITVAFDDGWESIYTTAMPELQKYGIHTTQYILTGVESYPGYMSWPQVKAIKDAGHEIGCHSIDHPDLTTLSNDDLMHQLQGCKEDMSKHLSLNVTDFASPYGSYNDTTIAAIKKVYASQRNINGVIVDGINDKDINLASNFDPANIIGVTVRRDTTVEQLQQLVNYTVAHNGWLVLVYHQADDGPSQYGIDPNLMDKQLSYLSHTNIPIVTVNQVISSLKAESK